MIRIATDSDFPQAVDCECALRICALNRAYGCANSFLRFYTDGEGSMLSLMDGVGVLYCPNGVNEEWIVYLAMNPEIHTIHCSGQNAKAILSTGMWSATNGVVMKYDGGSVQEPQGICTDPYLPTVYELLKEHFAGIPSFDAWYPDASHRVRHQLCHVASIIDGDKVVSSAMTVAESEDAALLGQVVTHPDYRRRGMAAKCLKSLMFRCKAKTLYILPVDNYAQQLYEKLGFSVCGDWAELKKLREGALDNE